MRSILTFLYLLSCIFAVASEPPKPILEQGARAYRAHLPGLAPEQRADAIILWWNSHDAEFHPYPQSRGIRFYDEMIGCKEAAVPALKAAMSSVNPQVRIGASAVLRALGPLALPVLEELKTGIEDSDWRVRESSTMAVSNFGCLAGPAIPSMIKNLRHESALLRGWTVFSLGYLGEVAKPAVPELVEMLRHPETFESGWKPDNAVKAISRIVFEQFADPDAVLVWWEKTGKKQFGTGPHEQHENAPGWTTYKRDGSMKAKGISQFEGNQLVKTEVYDGSGNLEFIEIPVYDPDDIFAGKKRIASEGKPWPYDYAVYGAASIGGILKVQDDIKKIETALSEIQSRYPILEIVFLDANRVEVNTGENGRGQYYDFERDKNTWKQIGKNVITIWKS